MKKRKKRKQNPRGGGIEKSLNGRQSRLAWAVGAVLLLGVLAWGVGRRSDSGSGNDSPSETGMGQPTRHQQTDVPPFFADADAAKPFPPTVSPWRYPIPFVSRAYGIAGEIPGVLAQQPCYCYCDGFGHRSLLDCYASDHGAG